MILKIILHIPDLIRIYNKFSKEKNKFVLNVKSSQFPPKINRKTGRKEAIIL